MSIQLSKRYPGASEYAATQFKAALADGGGYIATNAQNLQLTADGSNYQNPYFSIYNGRNDLGQSATMTSITNATGDARQNAFGGASEQKGQNATSNIGVPYGVNRTVVTAFTDANPGWARVLRGDLRTDVPAKPTYILTAAEVALARAEAANLGWTTEVLATVYAQGIALSFEQWGAGTPSPAYMAQADVALTGGVANAKNIAVQRWLASYPDGLQGWNIWRKSGYPVLTPAPNATSTKKQIIRRYVYGTDERTSNLANLNAAIARIPGGVDEGEARVWWDQ
ncbi:SusD/RagB family nutrient-binding outer membrane lipoprotein [Pedobacter sp. UC225_61]|uniref:SusD/RagB family nutrient-binding outer membrane lipoprotein n=1 Tax=Pedobacter sp. UC225_61 TaxID=3374623 RepID=UPI0037BA611A